MPTASSFDYSIVNAFITDDGPHSGNQAAVVLQTSPRPDSWKAAVARDFNFSETAYLEPISAGRWGLRWFTPGIEAELCGHATLAAAAFLFEREPELATAHFETRWSGELRADRKEQGVEISLPTIPQATLDQLQDEALLSRHRDEAVGVLRKAMPDVDPKDVKRVFRFDNNGESHSIIELEGSVPLSDLKVDAKPMVSPSLIS